MFNSKFLYLLENLIWQHAQLSWTLQTKGMNLKIYQLVLCLIYVYIFQYSTSLRKDAVFFLLYSFI